MSAAPRSAAPASAAVMALIAGAALIAWLILPTAPNYDTATHLVWARELLHGRSADFAAAAAPTLHPLWLLVSFPAAATGSGGAVLQLVGLLAFGVVVACAWRLAADIAGRVAGVVASLAVLSSFALFLDAYKAYADLPFLALALSGVVAERAWEPGAGRHRWTAPVLFAVAGLLRPEAWAFGLLVVALRAVRGGELRAQVAPALVVLAAPVIWMLSDWALTGDPLRALTGTQQLAEELGRRTGLAAAPVELIKQLADLVRPPVAAAGLSGVALAVWLGGWRRVLVPLAPLVAGAAGFLLIGALGLPLLQRYLLLPGVLLAVFAGVGAAVVIAVAFGRELPVARVEARGGVSGATAGAGVSANASAAPSLLVRPVVRWIAVASLALGVVGAGGYLVLKAGSFAELGRGVLREARWQQQAAELVGSAPVRSRLANGCGPITLPTYRLIPELQLRTGLRPGQIVSRAGSLGGAGPQDRGIALVVVGSRDAKERMGWAAGVPRATNQIPDGYTEIARRGPLLAAARCNDVTRSVMLVLPKEPKPR